MDDNTLEESITTRDKSIENVSEGNQQNNMSKEEQIGYHKGAIDTLIAERNEMLKIVSITEQLINAHAAELKRMGIDLK